MTSLCNGLIMVVVLNLPWHQSATLTRHGCVWRLLARWSNILASLFVLKEVRMLLVLEESLHSFSHLVVIVFFRYPLPHVIVFPGRWMVRVDYDEAIFFRIQIRNTWFVPRGESSDLGIYLLKKLSSFTFGTIYIDRGSLIEL